MGFCEKCGKELAEGEQCTCTAEGAVQESVAEAVSTQEATVAEVVAEVKEEPVAEKKPAMDKNKLTIIGVVAAVVVLLLLVAVIAGGSKGYMEPVEDFMKEINKKNTNPVEVYGTLMPDFAADLYLNCHKQYSAMEEYLDIYEEGVDNLEDYYDDCDDEFDKWKLSFEMRKASKLDKDDLEDIQDDILDDYYKDNYLKDEAKMIEDLLEDDDDLEDAADDSELSVSKVKSILKAHLKYVQAYEELKVTAGYEVKGKFVVKSGKDEYDTETVEFVVLKINGDWTYWGLESGSLSFDDDDENCFGFLSSFLKSKKLYRSIY